MTYRQKSLNFPCLPIPALGLKISNAYVNIILLALIFKFLENNECYFVLFFFLSRCIHNKARVS